MLACLSSWFRVTDEAVYVAIMLVSGYRDGEDGRASIEHTERAVTAQPDLSMKDLELVTMQNNSVC
jgi:hypothetical protein